jgi:ketosteroid isomerase-like protein
VAESADLRLVREMFVEFADLSFSPEVIDAWLTHFSEDVVWEAIEDAPDAGTYRGHAGIRGYVEDWMATVDEPRVELLELEEVAGCVVGKSHFAARIKGTDNELGLDYWLVWRLTDGKICRVKEFWTREEAVPFAEAGAPAP